MTHDTPQPEAEQPQADASIDLRMDKGGLQINVAGDDHSNQAVHFAHWIGRNLALLQELARPDYQLRKHLVALPVRDPASVIKTEASRMLVGPDAKPLN